MTFEKKIEIAAQAATVLGILFLAWQIRQANLAISETRVQIELSRNVARLGVLSEIRRSLDQVGVKVRSTEFVALRSLPSENCSEYTVHTANIPNELRADVEEIFRHYEYIFEANRAKLFADGEWDRICKANLAEFVKNCGVAQVWKDSSQSAASVSFQEEMQKCISN